MRIVLNVKLVVIRELKKDMTVAFEYRRANERNLDYAYLFATKDFTLRENDDAHITIDFDDLRHTIRIARVIDVTCQAAAESGIDNTILVQAEHINATIL